MNAPTHEGVYELALTAIDVRALIDALIATHVHAGSLTNDQQILLVRLQKMAAS